MADIKDGGPAFSVSTSLEAGQYGHRDGPETWQFPGMTLRDYFAGQWLMGYMANPEIGFSDTSVAAAHAYKTADAMLRAREANHG